AGGELRVVGIGQDLEWIVDDAEVAGRTAAEALLDPRTKLDERRHSRLEALLMADHRAEAGIDHVRVELVPGHHDGIGAAMRAVARIEAAQQAEAANLARHARSDIAETDTGNGSWDGAELAADAGGGGRLGGGGVVSAGAAH